MGFVPLIEVTRGGLPECQHWGAVAVANRKGRVLAQVGDPDTPLDESLTALADAMVARPELGSGTGRHDLDFIRAGRGDWVSKTGVDGVQVMDQLGWLDASQRHALASRRTARILNARGVPVGERRPVFRLQVHKII